MDAREAAFLEHCLRCGVLIKGSIKHAKMTRVPTVAHPGKLNGAYIYGARGEGCIAWDGDGVWHYFLDRARLPIPAAPVAQAKPDRPTFPIDRATRMLSEAIPKQHAYLDRKGFAGRHWQVWKDAMLVSMHQPDGVLCGIQLIDAEGNKRMMRGSRMKMARHVLGDGKLPIIVEGLATGLSVLEAAQVAKVSARVLVAFCAGNLTRVARSTPGAVVIADNDASGTGQRAAQASRRPYWMPDETGMDANDLHVAGRLDAVCEAILELAER